METGIIGVSESGLDVGKEDRVLRAEIDTSAPFQSVKEAVSRFGGVGYWKPSQLTNKPSGPAQHDIEDVDTAKLEEQALQLEKDLTLKERETLDVLIELEETKKIIDELKRKLQEEVSEVNVALEANGGKEYVTPVVNEEDKENHGNVGGHYNSMGGMIPCPSSAPGLILMELKQAKMNLTRTTTDLADIRASVESLNKKLEKERTMLEKTRVRLTSNSLKVLSLEEELNQTKLKLQLAKDGETKGGTSNSLDISKELQRLSSETEQFKRMAEAAKLEILRATSEIEQTGPKIKTAEIRLVAARKMKEAARAVEAVALAEIKALSYHESSSEDSLQKYDDVTLSFEEYSALTRKVRDAEELSKKRVTYAMLHVEEANVSKTEILKKVEEVTEEVKTSKKELEEALNRVEAANRGKLAVEEALRKWRSQHGQRRRSVHNSTKFKNPCPSNHRKDLKLRDVNGLNLGSDGPTPVLKPTLSIGQILSRKLLLPEEVEMEVAGKNPVKQSIHCFLLDESASSTDDAIREVMLAWPNTRGCILYMVSNNKEYMFPKLSKCSWLITLLNVEGSPASTCESSSMVYINKLRELPLTICQINRKAFGNSIVTVGYIMKPSREGDFAKRGAFPMYPTQDGLMFVPLTFDLPLAPQLQEVDVVLHKATDEIISINLDGSLPSSTSITYSRGMQELQRYMEHHLDLCVIDPLSSIYPVVDRLKIQQILLGLEDLKTASCCAIRGPNFLKVDDFNQSDLVQSLSEAKLALPSIVKPQVACGVADAHSMAIVFRVEDFKDLTVPLPAIIQEYVDHSSTLYKFYVLGEKVYHAVKSSTPNADGLKKLSGSKELKPLVFDSLKSLPTAKGNLSSGDGNSSRATIELELVTSAANWLMRNLELTIFGFDVVIEEGTGDHVIVDVNYLPSFKEVPNEVAIPAFWGAIKKKFELRGRNK